MLDTSIQAIDDGSIMGFMHEGMTFDEYLRELETSSIRAIRNNNPGNIITGEQWQGLEAWENMTPAQREEKRFCVFKTPKWGFRAIERVLISYQDRHGLNTIRAIINRYAPPFENNTEGYIQRVAKDLGITPEDEIDVRDWNTAVALVTAIALVETGGEFPWSKLSLEAGLVAAGLAKPARAISANTVAAAGMTAGGVLVAVQEVKSALDVAAPLSAQLAEIAPWLGAGASLIVVGLVVWTMIRRRNKVAAEGPI